MKKDLRCPICEEGNLSEKISKDRVSYKGETAELDLHFSVCDSCGSEQVNVEQSRLNKRYMVAFKKQVDGLLTGSEVRSIRENLRLRQLDAARIFGGGPVAFSKYEADDVTQSEAMDRLLRVAAKVPEAFDYLVKHAQVKVDVHAISYATRQTSYRTLSSWCFTGSGNVGVIYGCGDSLVDCSGMWPDRESSGGIEAIPPRKIRSSDQYKRLQ